MPRFLTTRNHGRLIGNDQLRESLLNFSERESIVLKKILKNNKKKINKSNAIRITYYNNEFYYENNILIIDRNKIAGCNQRGEDRK